jgi:predicted metalloendopeptidase
LRHTQKIGDYYASCVAEAAIEKRGAAPLELLLAKVNALKETSALPADQNADVDDRPDESTALAGAAVVRTNACRVW